MRLKYEIGSKKELFNIKTPKISPWCHLWFSWPFWFPLVFVFCWWAIYCQWGSLTCGRDWAVWWSFPQSSSPYHFCRRHEFQEVLKLKHQASWQHTFQFWSLCQLVFWADLWFVLPPWSKNRKSLCKLSLSQDKTQILSNEQLYNCYGGWICSIIRNKFPLGIRSASMNTNKLGIGKEHWCFFAYFLEACKK